MKSRLRPIFEAHGVTTLTEAMQKIETGLDKQLKLEIVDAMTTNETSWFRDVYPFEYLYEKLFPKINR